MKANYKIISAKDFIKAKPSGEVDLEQSKKVLIELAAIAEPPPTMRSCWILGKLTAI